MEYLILQTFRPSLNSIWSLIFFPLDNQDLTPHLFRTEYTKIVSVICNKFGLKSIELAEDIVSDTFLKASETWGLKGVPKNPTAWLYTVAKNNTHDYFKREQLFKQKIEPELKQSYSNEKEFDIDLTDKNISDSQLQMLFAVCTPVLSKESQLTFALRILCGFGIDEIASALLTSKSTINKRLTRAKNTLKVNNIDLTIPNQQQLIERLDNVLSIIYLVFNEGYYSTSAHQIINKDMCIEAMRLTYMLLNFKQTNTPKVNAIMALFCFHSSRFDARQNKQGEQILYHEQDDSKWDTELIEKGKYFLQYSTDSGKYTKYNLEALIAFWHTQLNVKETEKWENILQLYNQLIQIEYSPITAINRTYALYKTSTKSIALKEALKIGLDNNHFYHLLLVELYDDKIKQLEHLNIAFTLANTKQDKAFINRKINQLSV